jgi:hypothetical protein
MNPGRELDALVAEKVMGWGWRRGTSSSSGEIVKWLKHPNSFGFKQLKVAHGDEPFASNWTYDISRYSTRIKDAWQVVKRLRTHHKVDLHKVDLRDRVIKWEVVVIRCSLPEQKFTVVASTAPHAICLAALEAVK